MSSMVVQVPERVPDYTYTLDFTAMNTEQIKELAQLIAKEYER